MKKLLFLTVLFFISISCFSNDILTLNNSQIFKGKVSKIKDCMVVFKAEGVKYYVPATDIYSIEFENKENKVYTDYLESLSEEEASNCLKGSLDAENFHGKKGGHFALGVLFGPFAMIGTALSNPTPDRGKKTYMLSENKELFDDLEYLSCYKKKAKGQLILMEGLGWATWILIVLALQ